MSYSWVILDTETTGITPPIYVVEVAALSEWLICIQMENRFHVSLTIH